MDEIEYFEQQQFDQIFNGLENALKKRNDGRNKQCFPLVSFGWKDADLDPEGCTGIRSISNITEDTVSFIVGGHKTFCPLGFDEDQEIYRDQIEAQEQFVIEDLDYPGDWSGDDWSIRMEDRELSVQLKINEESGDVDYDYVADQMIFVAKIALAHFWTTMKDASKDFENIHNQLRRD